MSPVVTIKRRLSIIFLLEWYEKIFAKKKKKREKTNYGSSLSTHLPLSSSSAWLDLPWHLIASMPLLTDAQASASWLSPQRGASPDTEKPPSPSMTERLFGACLVLSWHHVWYNWEEDNGHRRIWISSGAGCTKCFHPSSLNSLQPQGELDFESSISRPPKQY